MKWLKKVAVLAMAVSLMVCTVGRAKAISTNAISTCVMDVDSGRVLYANNETEQRPIASTTKIMTGLLACELSSKEDLKQVLTCSKAAREAGGSSLYMELGDKITLKSCIYGTMLRSGNDCAVLLAEYFGGDVDTFIDMMNDKAEELGMENTHYATPNGLQDKDNYSTAYDMCLLGSYAIQNQRFAKVVGTWYIETKDGWKIENHNKLLQMDERCIGIKTGYTDKAGRTLVSCFQDPDTGQRIVCCTLYDSYDFEDHIKVYEWAFQNYPVRTLCQEGKTVTTFSVGEETYNLTAENTVTYPMTDKELKKVFIRMMLPRNQVELSEGDTAGEIIYYLNKEEIGRTNLICTLPETEVT
jgi:D-alanyl-D-alanine carboxypeptidase